MNDSNAQPTVPPMPPTPPPTLAQPSRPLPRRGRGLLWGTAGLVLATALVGLGAARWGLYTESGARWLLTHAPGVQASGVEGTLLGGTLRMQQLQVRWSNDQAALTLDDLAWTGLRWRWRPREAPELWLALDVAELSARQATFVPGPPSSPPSDAPLKAPGSLALPLQVTLGVASVGRLQIDQQPPATDLRLAKLALDSRAGAAHSLQSFSGQWQGVAVSASGQVAHAAPFETAVQAALNPVAGGESPAWGAAIRAQGPLEKLGVQATLRGVPAADKPAPSLDLRVDLMPFQPWPLGEVDLKTAELDLSALLPTAPQTRLDATTRVRSQGLDQPVSAAVRINNALPGRYDEGRLPVAQLEVDLAGRIDQPNQIDVSRFELSLADALRPAGRLIGKARWQDHQLNLDARLQDIAPHRLDGHAAAMTLSGPLAVVVDGLPSPDPAQAASAAVPPWQVQLRTTLTGVLDGAPQPVKLSLQAQADANRLEIKQAVAETGVAQATASARLQRANPRSNWQLATQGKLSNFNPVPWLPGGGSPEARAWQRGPHKLSGQWQLDLRLPGNAEQLTPLNLLQRVAGNGKVKLVESQLAGLPLQADVDLSYAPGGPSAATTGLGKLAAQLQLAGSVLTVSGSGNPAGEGQGDQLRAELQADQLAALAPLLRMLPELSAWAPTQGGARMRLSASGRWPALRTEGSAQVQQLKAGTLALQRGHFDWTLDSGPGQPLAVTLDVASLQLGKQRAEQVRGRVRGNLSAHRIDIEALLPVLPPPAAASVLGLTLPASAAGVANGAASARSSAPQIAAARGIPSAPSAATGTRALLLAKGAWLPAAPGGGRWQADIERLAVGGWDGTALPALPGQAAATVAVAAPQPITALPASLAGPTWVDASNLRLELAFGADGAFAQLRAAPGRIRLADTATLRWDEVLVDLQATPAQISLRADVEPFAVAPLLARLQPDMGWTGDLNVGARVVVQATERIAADILIERAGGDLAAGGSGVADLPQDTGRQAMGLSELRLALRARDGIWAFQADVAGARLGELRGQVQVTTTPAARWPQPDAPLKGQINLRVADIGIWNAWVPAGWRLAGQMQGMAAIDGTFGAPRYTGELLGSQLALRNLLQGVNVGEGEVRIKLAGDTAQIERFALRGGEGTLTISGNAVFGASPQAQLNLQAERFRLLGRVDRLLIASGRAKALFGKDGVAVDGNITIDEGLFDISRGEAPSLDEDVNVRRPGAPAVEETETTAASPKMKLAINIELDMGSNLRLRGYGLDTGLRGKLKVTTPGGRLAFNGTINTVDGTYLGYGQKMAIDRGIVAFNGPLDTARLDLLAVRPKLDIVVGVAATGPLGAPRIRLVSEPEMSENAKLSWLLLGREPDGLGRNETALLQRAAVALLSGEGEAPTDTLLRSLGIDELSLRQSDGDTRETVITVGKQLSQRWYLGYERGVNATTGTWQLIYRIAQRFTLRAQSGLENSLDLIWIWRVGETPATPNGPGSVRKSVRTPP